jgi:TetR/AcrR family transcriptional repressor of nem operon
VPSLSLDTSARSRHSTPRRAGWTEALAVIDEGWLRERAGRIAPTLTGSVPPLERLLRLLERGLEMQMALKETTGTAPGCSFGTLVVELATVDEVLRERLARLFDERSRLLQGALEEAVAAGDLPEVDTGQAARAVLAYMEGLAVIIKAKNDPTVACDLVPLALRLVGGDPAAVRGAPAAV